ncbi:MAG: hypothetical protein IPK13_20440 [Deltaproteobacteria bacterium]|nr:hypothetical protein [Deltaproteobacteria bacterium]
MAGQGAEYSGQIEAWIAAYEALPDDRKASLTLWFATQRLIVENAGISLREWCGYLEWAMHNPLDYSFIVDFPEKKRPKPRDESQRGDETSRARSLIGADVSRPNIEGTTATGMREKSASSREVDHDLLARFMQERMKPGSGTK